MKKINKKQHSVYSKIIMIFGVFCLLSNFLMAPSSALAAQSQAITAVQNGGQPTFLALVASQTITASSSNVVFYGSQIPNTNIPIIELKDLGVFTITAYSSDAAQTDSDPCTTADGFNVCKHNQEDIIATNSLPFGTKVEIPALFGDRIFIVHDRMNRRFSNRMDIWMTSYDHAISFGLKQALVEVVQ